MGIGARYVEACLQLLEQPYELYQRASDEVRRRLNQAVFTRVFVYNNQVTGHELQADLRVLVTASTVVDSATRSPAAAHEGLQDEISRELSWHRGETRSGAVREDDAAEVTSVNDLLRGAFDRDGCSREHLVREAGLEPARP